MRSTRWILPFVLAAGLGACGKDDPAKPGAKPTPPAGGSNGGAIEMPTEAPVEGHEHVGLHGGAIVELGEHEAHLELVHEPATGTLSAYLYDADMKPVAVEAPVVNLTKAGVQVPMTPVTGAGPTSDGWKAVHEALKKEPEGRLRVKLGGKTFQADLAHEHEPK